MSRSLSAPPRRGTCLDSLGKNPGKVTLVGKTRGQRNFAQRLTCIEKKLFCSFDSLRQQPLMWRETDRLSESLAKVTWG
jgi:hypothetical protein